MLDAKGTTLLLAFEQAIGYMVGEFAADAAEKEKAQTLFSRCLLNGESQQAVLRLSDPDELVYAVAQRYLNREGERYVIAVGRRIVDKGLTEREREVLHLACSDCDRTAIAAQLGISESTVKTHLSAIRGKLDLHTGEGVGAFAVRFGLVDIETSR